MLRVSCLLSNFCKYTHSPRRNNQNRQQTSQQSAPDHEYLYGINAVQIALNAKRRKLHRLYIEQTQANSLSSRVSNIVSSARQLDLEVELTAGVKLDKLCDNQPHQHVVLKCSPIEYINVSQPQQILPLAKVTVFVDKVTDPQNFGAILRSCHFYGINKVIVNQQHKCPLNSTVSKTSAGALELMDIYAVKGTTSFVEMWKQQGNKIICTGMPRKMGKITYLDEFRADNYRQGVMVIVGSEATGVSPHLMTLADQTVMIRKLGPEGFPNSLVDSLNVNAATCTILYQLTRQVN